MNEDDFFSGLLLDPNIIDIKVNKPVSTTKNSIPDAKYYLIRLPSSDWVYLMDKKPKFQKSPFYDEAEGSRLSLDKYFNEHAISYFNATSECGARYCFQNMGLIPEENSIAYVFDEPNTPDAVTISLTDALSTDTAKTDKAVSEHYTVYNWHIGAVLQTSPFKEYIEKHFIPKNVSNTSEQINKRLLI